MIDRRNRIQAENHQAKLQRVETDQNVNDLLNEDNEQFDNANADTDFDNFTMDMAPQERTEALKILGKRQRRVGKIEECSVDVAKLFERQKRFCPSNHDGNERALSETTISDYDDRRL